MDDAGLNRRFGKDGDDGFRKPLSPSTMAMRMSSTPRFFSSIHDAQPEFCPLILLEPQAENLLGSVGAYAERDIHRLVAHQPLVADLTRRASKKTNG